MQVFVWAAFRGHLCADQEFSAVDLAMMEQREACTSIAEAYELDFDDPFMREFLDQEDFVMNTPCEEVDLFEDFECTNADRMQSEG